MYNYEENSHQATTLCTVTFKKEINFEKYFTFIVNFVLEIVHSHIIFLPTKQINEYLETLTLTVATKTKLRNVMTLFWLKKNLIFFQRILLNSENYI